MMHIYYPSGTGRNYNYSQDHCYIKLASKDTNGALCVVEDTIKPGFHLKRHHHKIMTEVFYMLEGEMKMTMDDETIVLKPGDTLTIPPNVWHAAYCENGGKMLTIFKDGQFDVFLERLSVLTDQDFSDQSKMQALAEEFDIFEI